MRTPHIEEEGAAAKAGGIFSACSREREACVSPGAELSGERRPRERCWRRGAMEWAWVFAGEEELAAPPIPVKGSILVLYSVACQEEALHRHFDDLQPNSPKRTLYILQ